MYTFYILQSVVFCLVSVSFSVSDCLHMINLFVCCHKPSPVPAHPLLVPLQVGSAISVQEFPGFLHDNTGDNISFLNRSYCELTAQYWAWKNYRSVYYGFFHYRRYLYPDMSAKRPYRLEKHLTEETLKKLNFDQFASIIPQYDIILPKAEEMHVSVRDHYASAPFHHLLDLRLAEEIVKSSYPSYGTAMKEYFSQTKLFFGNIFIMSNPVFYNYCNWLFPILKEFSSATSLSNRSPQEMRAPGYLAERLLGVYYTYHQNELKTLCLPRVHFLSGKEYYINYAINSILPPGSKIRSKAKQLKGIHK